jgi:hypothetical protein
MATVCVAGTGAVPTAGVRMLTEAGVTDRLLSPYDPGSPFSTTEQDAPSGMPSTRTV